MNGTWKDENERSGKQGGVLQVVEWLRRWKWRKYRVVEWIKRNLEMVQMCDTVAGGLSSRNGVPELCNAIGVSERGRPPVT